MLVLVLGDGAVWKRRRWCVM